MKYSVVIPTYNHCDDLLKPCIESILKYSLLDDIEIVVSANGCTDETKSYLEELKIRLGDHLKIAWSDSALGYPKATNNGIKEATTNKIILLNNDTVLLEQKQNDWLNFLESPFLKNNNCGISCVVKTHSKIVKRDFAIFFCVMIDRKVFDKIGLLNEDYGTGSSEDIEFCILAQNAGFEICEALEKHYLDNKFFTGNFPIYHLGEGTVHDESLVQNWNATFLTNSIKLASKYNEDWKANKIMNKKIGVITPVHNDSKNIFNAIDSVKSQTVGNVIHYIFDDASTDGLEEAMKSIMHEPDIRYVRVDENRGQSYGRNTLIELALQDDCEYLAFLDSDDVWYREHLEQTIPHLNENDVIYSTPLFKSEANEQLTPVNICVPDIFVGKQLLHNNYIWISSVVAKSQCFKVNKFDSSLDSIEDWDMWIRLYQQSYIFKKKESITVEYLVKQKNQASIGQTKIDLMKYKHKLLPKLKLHLACGHDYNDDYINVDLYAPDDAVCDVRFDVQKLPYPDNSVDEIKAFHIIEHFHFFEIKEVLNEWYRVLKPGGKLYLETPDFLETCRSFVEGSPVMPIEDWRILLYGHFFAHPWVPGQTHKFLFTETQLRTNLEWAGFKKVVRVKPASRYVMDHTSHMFLTVEAFK